MFIIKWLWYSMNSIKKIWGIRCNSNPNFTRILRVIPYKKHISPMDISFYARIVRFLFLRVESRGLIQIKKIQFSFVDEKVSSDYQLSPTQV